MKGGERPGGWRQQGQSGKGKVIFGCLLRAGKCGWNCQACGRHEPSEHSERRADFPGFCDPHKRFEIAKLLWEPLVLVTLGLSLPLRPRVRAEEGQA